QARLWSAAGLGDVETREFEVQREFADFEGYWAAAMKGSQFKQLARTLPPDDLARLKAGAQRRVDTGARPLRVSARANAVKGRVAKDVAGHATGPVMHEARS
ncbi:MAG TPA: hypothetical protein VH328_13930, partial [Burkholderiaceae bacterium]|nr:hypothetical protein [Burkholderiaceae bacterium]